MNTSYVGPRCKPAAVVATVLLTVVSCGCVGERPPARPPVVATDAVAVAGSKTVWWQHCTVSEADGSAHCRIWNAGGLVLYDEIFLPYDERTKLTKAELTIAPEPTFPGPD